MENLVIQLRPYVDLVEPEFKRAGYGWKPEMNQDESWLSGAGPWKAKASRVIDCDKAIVLNPDHEIVCVAEITGVQKIKDRNRTLIHADVQNDHAWVGKKMEVKNRSQNPITYVETPIDSLLS